MNVAKNNLLLFQKYYIYIYIHTQTKMRANSLSSPRSYLLPLLTLLKCSMFFLLNTVESFFSFESENFQKLGCRFPWEIQICMGVNRF